MSSLKGSSLGGRLQGEPASSPKPRRPQRANPTQIAAAIGDNFGAALFVRSAGKINTATCPPADETLIGRRVETRWPAPSLPERLDPGCRPGAESNGGAIRTAEERASHEA